MRKQFSENNSSRDFLMIKKVILEKGNAERCRSVDTIKDITEAEKDLSLVSLPHEEIF